MKVLIIVLVFLLSFQGVHALAITQPMPSNLTLKRGDSIPFKFEIQAITSNEDQICTYSVSGLNPLKITFEEEQAVIDAGKVLEIYGRIDVPFYAPAKEFEGKLSVNCRPLIEAKGVSVITQATELPFNARVIESKPHIDKVTNIVFILVILILLVFGLYKTKAKKIFKARKK
jgi:hypothetical protein